MQIRAVVYDKPKSIRYMKKTVSFFAAVLLAGSTMFAQAPQREEVAKQIDEYVF